MASSEDDDRLAVGKSYQGSVITKVKETRKTLVNGLIKVRKEIHLRGGMIMIEDSYVQPEEKKKEETKPKSKRSSTTTKKGSKKDAAAPAKPNKENSSAKTSSSSSSSSSPTKPSSPKPQQRASLKRSPNGGQSSSRQVKASAAAAAKKRSKSPARRSSVLSSMDTILDEKQSSNNQNSSSANNNDTKQQEEKRKSISKNDTKPKSNKKLSSSPLSPTKSKTKEFQKQPLRKVSSDKAPKQTTQAAASQEQNRRSSDKTGFSKIKGLWGAREAKNNNSSFGSLSNSSFDYDIHKSDRAEEEAAAAAAKQKAEQEAAIAAAEAIAEAKRQREQDEAKERRKAAAAAAEEKARQEAEAKRKAEEQARLEAEAKRKAEEKARLEAEAEEKARLEAEAKRKAAAEEKARLEAEAKRKAAAEEKARQEAGAKRKAAAEEKARQEAEAEAKRRAAAEEKARLEAEAKRKAAAEEKARQEAEAKRKAAAEEKAKQEAEEKARQEAEAQAEAERLRKEAEEKARLAELKAKKKAEDKAKKEAEKEKEKQRKKEEKLAKKAMSPKPSKASAKVPKIAKIEPPKLDDKPKQKQAKVDPVPRFSEIKGAWGDREKQAPAPSVSTNRRTHPMKLQNLCASKLDDTQPFQAPVHEKSFEDKNLIRRSIEDNFMFKNLPEADLAPLVDAFEKVEYEQGQTIVEQGDRGCFFYVIQDGEVSFNVNGEKVGSGQKGDTFGDSALVYSMPRNASVKSERSDTVLFRVGNTNFRHIMKASTLRNEDERTKLLQSVPFFQQVDEYDLKQLSAAMTPYVFRKGENLEDTFKKTPFCLIQRGSVQAVDRGSGNKKAKIGPGGSFGADSLAKEESSMANVIALSDGEALTIDRETFEKIFGNVTRLAIKSMDKQTLSKVKAIKAEEPTDIELDTLVRQVSEVKYRKDRHLFYRDTETGPSLYMVRRGSVKITTRDGKEDIITAGGYFGDDFLLARPKNPLAPLPQKVKAKCTAVTMEETVCGLLTLQEFRTVMSHKLSEVNEEQEDEEIQKKDLAKHRILGEGLFGQVWLVSNKHAADPVPYALKIQQTSDPHRPNAVADIRSEIKMMRHLSYPFIIEVVNVYEERKAISMLLSLAPGGELFDIIHHQDEDDNWVSGIGEKKGRFYAVIVADTLAFMHRRKYVFRDLKPENILIDKDGYPVLTDFGFTKRVTDKTFTFCGTPNYLPPEIVANRGHGISADNWSLGVLIYELIEGENPFFYEGMDQMALFESICNDTYYPIEEKTSKEALDLIDRLLEKDPNQRLGTFREKDILDHRWFRYCDIKKFREKKIEAPWKPGAIDLAKEEVFDEPDEVDDYDEAEK